MNKTRKLIWGLAKTQAYALITLQLLVMILNADKI